MILPIHKILCPTDFSEPSYEGLKAANELALYFAAKILLLHVVSPVPIMPATEGTVGIQMPSMLKDIEDSSKIALQRIAEEEIADGVPVESFITVGTPAQEIARLAEKEKADIIVIATHGQSGWQRFLSGSVTERVVRLAQCPVLTISAPKAEEH